MPGYRDRVIKLDFPDLAEDDDKIFVIIRNPRLLPPAEVASFSSGSSGFEAETGEDGAPKVKVADSGAAHETLHKMVARLVVAARVYDATEVGEFDPQTGEPTGEQPLLPPPPWDAAQAAKLPLPVLTRISQEFSEAVNPQKRDEPATQKTSSGSPSPSTTEPGAEVQSQPN